MLLAVQVQLWLKERPANGKKRKDLSSAVRVKYSNAEFQPKRLTEEEWSAKVSNYEAHFGIDQSAEKGARRKVKPKKIAPKSPAKAFTGK